MDESRPIAQPKMHFSDIEARFSLIVQSTDLIPLAWTEKFDSEQQPSPFEIAGQCLDRGLRMALRFTVYHRLSLLVLVPNVVVIGYWAAKKELLQHPTLCLNAVAANVAAAVLIRQDHVINLLFWTFGHLPHWTPLWLRRHAAKLYHLGGIHSGAGIAAGVWFLVFNIAAFRGRPSPRHFETPALVAVTLAMLMDVLLAQILFFSIPIFRSRFHNVWEFLHRFSGWLLLASFWAQMISYNIFQYQAQPGTPLARLFYYDSGFYLLLMTTISIILPWTRLRKVYPVMERLSDHAALLHFDYATVSACKTPRFATYPLMEWHSFASIPNRYSKGYSIIISRAGDWTSSIIDNPPLYLWTRGRPARGVLYMARIFKSVLCIGTGSGIAPILGLLTMPNMYFRVLWSTPHPETTFGPDIMRRVLRADPGAVIWNTTTNGRPDLVQQAMQIYEREAIEAVFVISNATVTRKVVCGLEQKGVPTFAPIFDS